MAAPVLTPSERLAVREDLADLAVFEVQLGRVGVAGLRVACEDCDSEHFHTWSHLRENLTSLLETGEVLAHEADHFSDQTFVTWDYCNGFVAGVNSERLKS